MTKQEIIISDNIGRSLAAAVGICPHDRLFVLADETTERLCLPLIAGQDCMREAQKIVVGATRRLTPWRTYGRNSDAWGPPATR